MNLPLTRVPADFTNFMMPFRERLSEPQYKKLETYTLGLIYSENKTVEGIGNARLTHTFSNSNYSHSLDFKCGEVDKLLDIYITHLRYIPEIKTAEYTRLIVDDILLIKEGDKIKFVSSTFDHAKQHHVKGQKIVTFYLITDKGHCFPVYFEFYNPKKCCKSNEEFKTKNQLMREGIEHLLKYKLKIREWTADRWYSVLSNLVFIKRLCDDGKTIFYSVPVKSDFRIRDGNKWVEVKEFYSTLSDDMFKDTEVEVRSYNGKKKKRKFKTFRKTVRVKKIGRVKLLITKEIKEDGIIDEKPTYLVSNNLNWDAKKMLVVFLSRWQIEVFHREGKVDLGFGDCQQRKEEGVTKHFFSALLANTFLRLMLYRSNYGEKYGVPLQTVGEAIRYLKVDASRNVVKFLCGAVKRNWCLEAIYSVLRISTQREVVKS